MRKKEENYSDMLRVIAERDNAIRHCILLEDENSKLKKLLELHGIEYPKCDVDTRTVFNWREVAGRGEKLCPTE